MNQYLLEIGCEEIPARFMPELLDNLKEGFTTELAKHKIVPSSLKTLGTYRRLAVLIEGLPDNTSNETLRIRGPIAAIAHTPDGQWTPAGLGFLKKNEASEREAKLEDEQGKTYVVLYKNKVGQPVKHLLAPLIGSVVEKLPLPIAMKWGNNQGPFVRPIRWIVSMWNNEVLPVHLFGIDAGNVSHGHRFLSNTEQNLGSFLGQSFVISSANLEDYKAELRKHSVIVDQNERKNCIENGNYGCIFKGYRAQPEDPLIQEVVFLTENPEILEGRFDKAYSDTNTGLPHKVLVETMKKHQKFFPEYLDENRSDVKNRFFVVADNVTDANKDIIKNGNEGVLKARLDDALFFWTEDLKTPLSSKLDKLKTIVFQKGLGSMYDKTQRIKALAQFFAKDCLNLDPQTLATIEQVAELCKADLATHMVFELPSLQGFMGSIYAKKEGLSEAVSKGILDHLKLDGTSQLEGLIVGLADRIDTIAACFANGLIPTGSRDPWGLRRAGNEWVVIFIRTLNDIEDPRLSKQTLNTVSPRTFFYKALALLNKPETHVVAIETFMLERFKTLLSDFSSYDVLDAVSDKILDTPIQAYDLACTLSEQKKNVQFKQLVETAVRSKRLAKEATSGVAVNPALFTEPSETKAYKAVLGCEQGLKSATIQEVIMHLAGLIEPLSGYFEAVLVMDKDPAIKQNRLAFLSQTNALFAHLGDLEKIVYQGE